MQNGRLRAGLAGTVVGFIVLAGAASAAAGECTELPGARVGECGSTGDGGPSQTSPGGASTTTTVPSRAGRDQQAAARLLALVNDERRKAGVPPLTVHGDITQIAWDHSAAMAAERRIWHNDAYFTAENRRRLGASALGENVALNRYADDAHARLMASPGHRSNILDPRFTHVGVTAVRDADGILYITQDFAQISSPSSSPAPASGPAPAPPPPGPAPVAEPPPPPGTPDGSPGRSAGSPTVLAADGGSSEESPVGAVEPVGLENAGARGNGPAAPEFPVSEVSVPDDAQERSGPGVAGAVMAIAAVGLCDRAGRRAAPALFRR